MIRLRHEQHDQHDARQQGPEDEPVEQPRDPDHDPDGDEELEVALADRPAAERDRQRPQAQRHEDGDRRGDDQALRQQRVEAPRS